MDFSNDEETCVGKYYDDIPMTLPSFCLNKSQSTSVGLIYINHVMCQHEYGLKRNEKEIYPLQEKYI